MEKIRAYCLTEDPRLGARVEEIRVRDYRRMPDSYFKLRLAAAALDIDDTSAAGRRALRHAVTHGNLRAHFTAEELAAAGIREASGEYPDKGKQPPDPRLAKSLAALNNDGNNREPTGDNHAFAQKLASFSNIEQALGYLRKRLPALKGMKLYEFLADIGYPAALPRSETQRLLFRLGLLKNGPDARARSRRLFFQTVERIARLSGAPMAEIDMFLGLYSGAWRSEHVDAVCALKPRCGWCAIRDHCIHLKYHEESNSPRETEPINTWGLDERPREKLLRGCELTNAELLAILIRTGTRRKTAVDLARDLLKKFETPTRLAAASPAELAAMPGIGAAKSATIIAALELGRRAWARETDERDTLPQTNSSKSIFEFYRARFQNETQELFILLMLNIKNRITRETEISRGTLNSSIVHPRDVFREALREAAGSVIFVHNHPSGDPTPSQDDRVLTRRLAEAGKILGIRVTDHVIVGAQRYYSFSDNGELE
ncbi:MAG: DNA repair protein RadC [bacterium]